MTSFLEQAGPKPYQRCLVMCGGGFRFGYYLGVYAAMEEHGHKPDLLLATCGAAIAANVIAGLETDAQRRAWLDSEAMFAFWQSLRWNPRQSMITVSKSLLKRWATPPQYKRIPDLYQDFLFSVPGELPLPPLPEQAGSDVAVIAAKFCIRNMPPDNGAAHRGLKKQFSQTARNCNIYMASCLSQALHFCRIHGSHRS
jgi:hypothetical protein